MTKHRGSLGFTILTNGFLWISPSNGRIYAYEKKITIWMTQPPTNLVGFSAGPKAGILRLFRLLRLTRMARMLRSMPELLGFFEGDLEETSSNHPGNTILPSGKLT